MAHSIASPLISAGRVVSAKLTTAPETFKPVRNGALCAGPLCRLKSCKAIIPVSATGFALLMTERGGKRLLKWENEIGCEHNGGRTKRQDKQPDIRRPVGNKPSTSRNKQN